MAMCIIASIHIRSIFNMDKNWFSNRCEKKIDYFQNYQYENWQSDLYFCRVNKGKFIRVRHIMMLIEVNLLEPLV